MAILKPAFLALFILLYGGVGFVFAQSGKLPLKITNTVSDTITYCSDSILIAPSISIENTEIDAANDGMKVSISNYKRGEDVLAWDALHGFNYRWNERSGYLEIKGAGSDKQYEEAIAKVYYKNVAEQPTLGVKSFSIGLLDADFLPNTKHFYKYISQLDITWRQARDSAANIIYHGLKGYLVTITSKVENDFIWTKMKGIGWIGATDEEQEGRWVWAAGPEAGTHFWQGDKGGYPVAGHYNNWNRGEPNNAFIDGLYENYAHVYHHSQLATKGSWNDLPNEGVKNSEFRPRGFIVEFGGMEDDPQVELSASAYINVAKIAFSNQRDFEICEGEQQELNLFANDVYSYLWQPAKYINSNTISNPIVNPPVNTVYTATGTLGTCTDTASFKLKVNPLPRSNFPADTTICKGDSLLLDPGKHKSYLWSDGSKTQTIKVADEKEYWVKLMSDSDCELTTTIDVKWSKRPVLDYSAIDTLVCGSKATTVNLSFIGKIPEETRLVNLSPNVKLENETSLKPVVEVPRFGRYSFVLEMRDEYACFFTDTLHIGFHNQPRAKIVMDSSTCKGYNLALSYGGVTKENALFSWIYNDSVYQSDINLTKVIIPLGYGKQNRKIGLKVNEQGCLDSSYQDIKVTPNVELTTQNNEGCTPLTVFFDAKATEEIESYLWDFGDGNTADENNTFNKYYNTKTEDESFNVALTVISSEGCENTGLLDKMIVVHPKPTVDLSFDEEDCNLEEMEIWYQGSAKITDTIYWYLSSLLASEILQNPRTTKGPLKINRSSSPTAEIGISVVSSFGCQSDTISKLWKRKPLFRLQIDSVSACPPLPVTIKALLADSVDNVSFIYDLGDGTMGKGSSVEHTYALPNKEHVVQFTGTSSVTACSKTVVLEDTIRVHPVPKSDFSPSPKVVLISNAEVFFENRSIGANSYRWDFGDNTAMSDEVSPTHLYSEMGFYNATLFAFNGFNCSDSTMQKVIVAFDKIFTPNAFSPNASLPEDREFRIHALGVSSEGYQLLIFNRWGELIFESNSQERGWDGKMKSGSFAPTGVYPWVLQYRDFRGMKHQQKGTVTLLF